MAWMPAPATRRRWAVLGLLIAAVAVPLLFTACGGAGSLEVNDLRNADAPYYYVGESFHGLKVTHVLRYQRGDAALIYGDCKARSDMAAPRRSNWSTDSVTASGTLAQARVTFPSVATYLG